MFEKFIEELEKKAKENNLNADELIQKYKEQYEIGIEAGLSEEEILKRFKSVDEIINEKLNIKNKRILKEFNISLGGTIGDVKICNEKGNKIRYIVPKNLLNDYEIILNNDIFKIVPKNNNLKRHHGDITIFVGEDIEFEHFEINNVNSDYDMKNFNIKCLDFNFSNVNGDVVIENITIKEKASINTVNGDFDINKFACDKLVFDTVNGDIKIDNALINLLKVSTVNGDFVANGIVKDYSLDTVNGDFVVNHQKISKSISERLK